MTIDPKEVNSTKTFTQLCEGLRNENPNFDRQQDFRLKLRDGAGGQMNLVQEKAGLLGGGSKDQQRAASVVLTTLSNEIGAARAMAVFNNAGLDINNTKFKVSDLGKIQEGIGQQILQKWSHEPAHLNNPQEHEEFVQQGVLGVMNDDNSQWNMASQGAGLTLLGNGVVVKLDSTSNVRCGEEISKLMTRVLNNAAGDIPFEAPRFAGVHGLNPEVEEVDRIKAMLEQQKVTNPDKMIKIQDNLDKLNDDLELPNQALAKMDMVPGKMLNELSTAEKLALFKSPQFAQDIGKAAVLCPMFGLNDHVAPSTDGSVQFGVGTSNLSNLMLNQQTGKLAIIDYATQENGGRIGAINPQNAIGFLKDYVEGASLDANQLHRSAVQACRDGAHGSYETPLCGTMSKFLQADNEHFFSLDEKAALSSLSVEDKLNFAKNMMRGAVDGLEYVHQNQQVFEQAYAQTLGVEINGAAPAEQHFVTTAEMTAIKDIVGNAQVLQQRMDQAGVPRVTQNVAPINLQPVLNAADNLNQPPLQAMLKHDAEEQRLKGHTADDDSHGMDNIKPAAESAENELDVDDLDDLDDLDDSMAIAEQNNSNQTLTVKEVLNAPKSQKTEPASVNSLKNNFKRQDTTTTDTQTITAGLSARK